jgi:hypothetical protein
MADVYLAQDRVLERPVAVKVFRVEPDELTRRRFADEARALARLSHPGLVAVYDVDVTDRRPFLVLQPVLGPSLQNRLLRGPLPAEEVRFIGEVMASALAHVHSRDVVHRDVKPSNILLDEQGVPHLGDFGIALLAGSARLTRVDEIIGTPAYLAPEQVLGQEVGPPVDVYALGLVLLECLTGEIEYFGGSEVEIALARLHRPPRIPADLPSDLAGLIAAMTATEPGDRPSAEVCEQHLRPGATAAVATSRLPAVAGAAAAAQGSSHRAHRGVWRAVGVAAAGAAALAAGLTLALGSPSPTSGSQRPSVAEEHLVPTQPAPLPASPTTSSPTTTTTAPPPSEVRHHHRHGGRDDEATVVREDDSGHGPGGPDDHGDNGNSGGHGHGNSDHGSGGHGDNGGGPGPG